VRLWHLADIPPALTNVCFRGESRDMTRTLDRPPVLLRPPACEPIALKGDPAFFSWDTPCGNWTQPVKETALIMTCCYWTIVPRSVKRSHTRCVEDVVCSFRSFPSRRAPNALRRPAARSGWASSLHEGINTE